MPWTLRMTLLLSLILITILVYFGIRLRWSVRVARPGKSGLFYVFFASCTGLFLAYPLIAVVQHSFGNGFSWESAPSWIVYPFWYGLIACGVLLSWFMATDIVWVIVRRVFKKDSLRLTKLHAYALLGVTGLVFLFSAVKLVWDTNRIVVDRISYYVDEPVLEGFTIVHIADLQADRYTSRKKLARYVDHINAAQPDVVVFGGDLVTEGTKYITRGAEALAGINAKQGVFAVIGDHDYWAGKDKVVHELEKHGITVLRDENHWIEYKSASVKLTGVTEIYNQKVGPALLEDLMLEHRGESLRVLFTHQATQRLISAAKNSDYHYLLGGHTHGGQIKIPVPFRYLSGARRDTPYVQGSWWFDDMLFHINNGLGYTLAPVRYNAPASVSIITAEIRP